MKKTGILIFVLFMATAVMTINLVSLLPNDKYEAAWWKVCLAGFIAGVAAVELVSDTRKRDKNG